MKTFNKALRERYQVAALALRERGEKVTRRSLSTELKLEFDAVRTYLNRNVAFAKELNVFSYEHNDEGDYRAAVSDLKGEETKVTHAKIAIKLGLDRTTVTRYLTFHPEVRPYPAVPRAVRLKSQRLS